ncbi:hypothetical protein HYU96_03735 [Candidatus Daviesbacteria bacterium]|nr:hypothetical protein [Candidatus Daviesbacteria bacterium]
MQQQYVVPWEKIKSLEEEIKALKALGKPEPKKKKKVKPRKDPIEGFLAEAFKGIEVTEKDLEEAEFKFDIDHILYQKHKK